jgi:hypothetical protein
MTDDGAPSNCTTLEEIVNYSARTQVVLRDGAFTAFKYYSQGKAVFFDLICGGDNALTHIQTYVRAKLPELA